MGIAVRSNFLPSDLVDYRRDKIASLVKTPLVASSLVTVSLTMSYFPAVLADERSHLNTSGCAMVISVTYSAMNEVK